jgi:hypothetical protein
LRKRTQGLSAGTKYDIKMEYYENGGGAVAQLSWSNFQPGQAYHPAVAVLPAKVTVEIVI